MKTWLFTVLIFMFSIAGVRADYNSATTAYNSGDRTASFMEFKRLAARGHVKAQFMLGTQYFNGEGVLQDYVQAHKWFNLAASAGHPLAGEYRDRAAARMTRAQVAEAQQLARQWQPEKSAVTTGNGTTPGATTPQVAATPGPKTTAADNTVARIQRLLNANGYNAGTADGRTGRKTRKAIRRYQADSGLYQDGEATPSLLTFMEAQFPQDSTVAGAPPVPEAPATTTPPPATRNQADERLPQLVSELQQLTRDAERSRAANNSFLGQLRDLVSRYSQNWPWYQVLLDEQFSAADYVRNPAWRITSGEFSLARGEGLRSQVSAPVEKKSKDKGRDLAINLLGSFLNSQQGDGGNLTFTRPEREYAAIYIPRRISNSFALRLVLNARSATDGVQLNLYQGSDRRTKYRLDYSPGNPGQLQMLRISSRGEILIASDNRSVDLSDGADHSLLWSRDEKGRMRVSIDGEERLRGTDTRNRGDYDGFGFINRGGDYTLRELRLYGTR